jgi:hypothetical protein
MSLSEVMTIVIAFHGSGYRTFKEFYTLQVRPHWQKARQRGLGKGLSPVVSQAFKSPAVSPMSDCRKKRFPT